MLAIIHADGEVFARSLDRAQKLKAPQGKRLNGSFRRGGADGFKRFIAALYEGEHGRVGGGERVQRDNPVARETSQTRVLMTLEAQQPHR